MDLDAEKRSLRDRMRKIRRSIGSGDARAAAVAAARRMESAPAFRLARRVGLYAAVPWELATLPLFDAVLAAGKPSLFPRVNAETHRLEFRPVAAWEELRAGRYGVPEPSVGPVAALDEEDLIVVPGLAFDPEGNRVGTGEGFFDRTFPRGGRGGPVLAGYAYEAQMVLRVPHGPRDRRMDLVVTEAAMHVPSARKGEG